MANHRLMAACIPWCITRNYTYTYWFSHCRHVVTSSVVS